MGGFLFCRFFIEERSDQMLAEKIRPFFEKLESSGALEGFDASEWLIEGTDASAFANTHLTDEEREELSTMAYASILFEA